MSQFKSKKQRKKVMKLVNQHSQNLRYAHRTIQSLKNSGMTQREIHDHIDKTEPYPNQQGLSKRLTEESHDQFMKKAFFKGGKGETIHKLVPNGNFDKNGKPYYTTSALEKSRHDVSGKGDFHRIEKFNVGYRVTKKDRQNPNFRLHK